MRVNLPVSEQEYPFPKGKTLVSITDAKGRILYCNQTFVDMSGFARDELLGQPHNIIRHPDVPEEAYRDLWQTMTSIRAASEHIRNIIQVIDSIAFQTNILALNAAVEAALTTMQDAVHNVRDVHASVSAMDEAITQQLTAISEINSAIASLDKVTRDNVAFADHLARQTLDLERLSEAAAQAVRVFRIDAHPHVKTKAIELHPAAR